MQACASESVHPSLRGRADADATGSLQAFVVYNGNKAEGSVQGIGESAPASTAIYSSFENGEDDVSKELVSVGKIAGTGQAKLYLRFDATVDVCTSGTKAIDVWNALVQRINTFGTNHAAGHVVVGLSFEKEKSAQLTCKGAGLDPTLVLSMANDPDNFPSGLPSDKRFETLKIEGGPDSVGKIDPSHDLSSGFLTPTTGSFTWDYLLAEYSYEPFDKRGKSIFPSSSSTMSSCLGQACLDRCSAGPTPISAPESLCPTYTSPNVPCTVPGLDGARELVDAGIAHGVDPEQMFTLGYGSSSVADCRTTAQGAIEYAFQQVSTSGVLTSKVLALLI